MLIESLILGIIILLLRREGKNYIHQIDFRHLWLPIFAFGLEGGASLISARSGSSFLFDRSFWIELMVYTALLAFVLINRRYKGIKLMGLGLMLNGLVVLFNGGMMPVDGTILAHLGYNETYLALENEQVYAHILISEKTKLSFLSDVIHVPPPYPFPKSLSLGDLFLDVGILIHLALFKTSRQVRAPTSEEVVSYDH